MTAQGLQGPPDQSRSPRGRESPVQTPDGQRVHRALNWSSDFRTHKCSVELMVDRDKFRRCVGKGADKGRGRVGSAKTPRRLRRPSKEDAGEMTTAGYELNGHCELYAGLTFHEHLRLSTRRRTWPGLTRLETRPPA